MKRLEVTVIKEKDKEIKEIFDKLELLCTNSDVKVGEEKCVTYSTLIPDQLIDTVVGEISQQIDLRVKEHIISVCRVESSISTYLERLTEKVRKENPPPNPMERLVASTDRYVHLNKDLFTVALFAALIALAGLFLDNVIIVIGAMLLSPLLGPINAFAVNATLGRPRKLVRSQISILFLLFSIVGLSAVITLGVSQFLSLPITSQIAMRGSLSLIDLVIALILGCAGGLALATAIHEILVGVAVAVALVPPATVAGIGIAFFDSNLFIGALFLTMVYLLGLQLGCTLMLRMKGITPRKYYQKATAKSHSIYSILILTTFLILFGAIIILLY